MQKRAATTQNVLFVIQHFTDLMTGLGELNCVKCPLQRSQMLSVTDIDACLRIIIALQLCSDYGLLLLL